MLISSLIGHTRYIPATDLKTLIPNSRCPIGIRFCVGGGGLKIFFFNYLPKTKFID